MQGSTRSASSSWAACTTRAAGSPRCASRPDLGHPARLARLHFRGRRSVARAGGRRSRHARSARYHAPLGLRAHHRAWHRVRRACQEGRLPLLDEAQVADSFNAVDGALAAAGFDHYGSATSRGGATSRAQPGLLARPRLPRTWYRGVGHGDTSGERRGREESSRGAELRYRNTPSPERYQASAFSEPTQPATPARSSSRSTPRDVLARAHHARPAPLAEASISTPPRPGWVSSPLPRTQTRARQARARAAQLQRHDGRLRIPSLSGSSQTASSASYFSDGGAPGRRPGQPSRAPAQRRCRCCPGR